MENFMDGNEGFEFSLTNFLNEADSSSQSCGSLSPPMASTDFADWSESAADNSYWYSSVPQQYNNQEYQQTMDLRSLTDEEKDLLAKQGVVLPVGLPLTKQEERTLKAVRRKIRNKESAKESRKKQKQYVENLEKRLQICSNQNQQMERKIQSLQNQNVSLLWHLKNLQALVTSSPSRTTTTGTCLVVVFLSFSLMLFPSFDISSDKRHKSEEITDQQNKQLSGARFQRPLELEERRRPQVQTRNLQATTRENQAMKPSHFMANNDIATYRKVDESLEGDIITINALPNGKAFEIPITEHIKKTNLSDQLDSNGTASAIFPNDRGIDCL